MGSEILVDGAGDIRAGCGRGTEILADAGGGGGGSEILTDGDLCRVWGCSVLMGVTTGLGRAIEARRTVPVLAFDCAEDGGRCGCD